MLCRIILLAIFYNIFASSAGQNCDNAHFYEDIGCSPSNEKNGECPAEYFCGSFKPSKDGCLFKNKTLKYGETIDDNLIYPACRINCRCQEQSTKPFTCAILDCPEWLGSPLKVGCHRRYEVNKCCSVGQVCLPMNENIKCEVGGKTYVEGERFVPEDSCLKCVCSEGYEGKNTEKFCSKQKCVDQIQNPEEVANNCAPVYFEKERCCPYGWVCPKPEDKIEVINANAKSNNLK
ncbi:unnamed protein product [Brassicogethes aeneus]|uniref:VWFC domain-containing protein n=1 Tax=Brassicogethes aeneus TaxID=1431903 RepID=A0A9P0BJ33_BRAAE|nr:unnamed protein product [Brassicogethes aeneus]